MIKQYLFLVFLGLHLNTHGQVESMNSLQREIGKDLKLSAEDGFNGTVLISFKNKIIHHKGYGYTDLNQQHLMTPDILFNVASITKSFTALGILILKEKGRLSFDDTLDKFFEDVPPDKKSITIHQLLTHTSGLQQNYVCGKKSERNDCVEEIMKDKIGESAGKNFGYSNENYELLAAIIEVKSGQEFEAFIKEQILGPAGLQNTHFWGRLDDRNPKMVAQKQEKLSPRVRQRNWDYLGSGGIYTTVGDLYKFYEALSTNKLLSEEAQQFLFTSKVKSKSGLGIGYGWFIGKSIRGTEEYWTRGSESFGHNAVFRWFPKEEIVIIVCSNTGERDGKTKTDNRLISDDLVELIFNKI